MTPERAGCGRGLLATTAAAVDSLLAYGLTPEEICGALKLGDREIRKRLRQYGDVALAERFGGKGSELDVQLTLDLARRILAALPTEDPDVVRQRHQDLLDERGGGAVDNAVVGRMIRGPGGVVRWARAA